MLTYINILQCILETKKIYYPIKFIKYKKINIYKINNEYWNEIYNTEFSQIDNKSIENNSNDSTEKLIKLLYFIFIKTISKKITSNVLNINQEVLINEKYRAYKNIIENIFLNETIKDKIKKIFERTQRLYIILTNFLKKVLYKIRKPNYKITMDLSLSQLDPMDEYTFIIYDYTQTITNKPYSYLFSIHDLVKIINTSITNSTNFFENPLHPKNPYTNIPLTENTLYAFFYKLYKIRYVIPPLLIKYFQSGFNLKMFSINNQMEIRDIIIKKYVMNSPINIIHEEILDMIDDSFYDTKRNIIINIDKNFPRTKLIEIMRPYLYLYLISNYHIYGSDKIELAKKLFRRVVRNFININPRFGQKHKIQKPDLISQSINKQFKFEFSPNPPMVTRPDDAGRQQVAGRIDNNSISSFNNISESNTSTMMFSEQPTSLGLYNFTENENIKPNSTKNKQIYFDDYPKFSIKDIEKYLHQPSKFIISELSQIRPDDAWRQQVAGRIEEIQPTHLYFDSEEDEDIDEESIS